MRFVLILGLAILAGGCAKAPPPLAHGKPINHWVEALQDPDARVRKKAVDVLGNIGAVDPVIVPALVGAVKDRDARVRAEAVLGLLRIGPAAREAIPVLEEAQKKDRDAKVRTYAGKALEKIQAEP